MKTLSARHIEGLGVVHPEPIGWGMAEKAFEIAGEKEGSERPPAFFSMITQLALTSVSEYPQNTSEYLNELPHGAVEGLAELAAQALGISHIYGAMPAALPPKERLYLSFQNEYDRLMRGTAASIRRRMRELAERLAQVRNESRTMSLPRPRKRQLDFDKLTDELSMCLLELRDESERGAALTGAAFLDKELELLIRSFLVNEGDEVNRLFQAGGNAPLRSFEAKIRLAYCLGLVAKLEHDELHVIRDIRNDFAHQLYGFSFDDRSVSDRCKNLKLVVAFAKVLKIPLGSARDRFEWSVMFLAQSLMSRVEAASRHRRKPLQ